MLKNGLIETEKLPEILSREIERWHPEGGTFKRLEYEIPTIDPLYWLAHQRQEQKLYWSNRERTVELAGIGSVVAIRGWRAADLQAQWAEMTRLLARDERLKFFGGMRFSEHQNGDQTWQAFPYFHFYLPAFEVIRKEQRTLFACNLYQPPKVALLELRTHYLQMLQQLFAGNGKADAPIRFLRRVDNPGQKEWEENIRRALHFLDGQPLEKVVLARKSELYFNRALKPERLLQEFRASNPNSFLFLFQPDKEEAFLGSTPERLFRRTGRHLETEAVAGTRRRGQTPEEDRQLKNDLLHCEKDLREHAYVVDSIERVLSPLSRVLEKDESVGILENARVQHLILRFRAELKEHVSDLDVLRVLHPTPAVGGVPKKEAIEKIHQLEHFDRGWYAGPVGWVSQKQAEFAVGIRSALLQGDKASLFAGAGIVQGSDPQAEWREIENKIANFIKILHIA